MPRAVVALLAVLALAAGCGSETTEALPPPPAGGEPAVVERVGDGDTLDLLDGRRVRLVQVDATELGQGECYADEAARELRALLPPGTPVHLEADPALDGEDRYGRLLRYVHSGTLNVNLELVRRGAATPYLRGTPGRYAGEIVSLAEDARAAGRGIWGACAVAWDPDAPAQAERLP